MRPSWTSLVAVLALFCATLVRSPDVWFHMALGRFVVENHAIPELDPFSFTVAGHPYRYADWLAGLVLYGAWSLGGATGLVAFKVLCVAALLYALERTLSALEVAPVPRVAAVGLFSFLVEPRYSEERPLLIGVALLGVALWLSVRARAQPRLWIWFIPLILVWLPCHGSVVLGVGVVAAHLADSLVARRLAAAKHAALLLSALAALFVLLPSGRDVWMHITALGVSPNITSMTVEWAPVSMLPRFPDMWTRIALLGGLAVGALGVVVATARGSASSAFTALLALGGALLASRGLRHVPEGLVLATPFMGELFEALRRRVPSVRALPAFVASLVLGAHAALCPPGMFMRHDFGLALDEERFPVELMDDLRALPRVHLLNSMGIGGFLIFERVPVFFDGRTIAVYTDEDVADFVLPAERDETHEQVVERFQLGAALAQRKSVLADVVGRSPRWVPVAFGRCCVLSVRSELAQGLPHFQELRWTPQGSWLDARFDAQVADPSRRAVLMEELKRAIHASPDSPIVTDLVQRMLARHPVLMRQAIEELNADDPSPPSKQPMSQPRSAP